MYGKDGIIPMNDVAQNSGTRKSPWIRTTLLVLALLTSPVLCCGGLQLLDALPSSWLPGDLDFMLNLFEVEARVENKTSQTLYLTAVTTTYGDPRVISQNITFRQRDIPVRPQSSVVLQYDSADSPLAGIVVCRTEDDCRLLPANTSHMYELNSYESLESLDPSWLEAIQSYPLLNYAYLMIIALNLVPILLFSGWLYLNWREKSRVG
jgi:hypothetical protein